MERLGEGDPQRVGQYTLLGRLGPGGMGAVYLGRSTSGARAAVTVMWPDPAGDRKVRERFRAAIAAARAVSGHFVAPVLDAGPDDPVPWVATAFVPGLSLRRAVARHGPLPEPALRMLATGLARALAGVHAAGVAHGGLEPGTVLLGPDGPYLVAFGASRRVEAPAAERAGDSVAERPSGAGSPGYTTPEQALEEPATRADDVLALGATLVFAASGREPSAEDAAGATAALPSSLREVIGGCLAPDRPTRPAAHRLVDSLERQRVPGPGGGWLPLGLRAEIAAAAAHRPMVSPHRPTVSPDHPDPARGDPTPPADGGVRRRRLLVGGGVVALGAAATAAGIVLTDSSSSSRPDPRRAAGDPAATTRPPGPTGPSPAPPASSSPLPSQWPRVKAAGPDATPAWQVVVDAKPNILAASDKMVMLGSEQSTIFLDASGKAVFRSFGLTTFGSRSQPLATFAAGVFYMIGLDRQARRVLGTIDATTGEPKWAVSLEDRATGLLGPLPAYVTVSGNTVYVCGTKYSSSMSDPTTGYIQAFDTATGNELWRTQGTDIDNVLIPPNGRYLLAGFSVDKVSHVQMLDAGAKGARGWKQPVPNAYYGTHGWPRTCFAGGLFVLGGDRILAVEPATGREVWRQEADDQPEIQFGRPFTSTDGTTVYIPVGEDLVSVNATDGTVKWIAWFGPNIETNAALRASDDYDAGCSADTVFVTDTKENLWALDPATGQARWKYNDPRQPNAGFIWTVGGDRVYIASNSTVTAIPAHA